MASVMSHELEETVTDPQLNAWYDSNGEENADKCAWTFGATYAAANGSAANMNLGGRDYLIQRNWLNASGGSCALSYNSSPDFSLSVSPASQTVSVGGTTGNYGLSVSPSNGFSSAVTLSVSGLPAWAAASSILPNPASASAAFTVSTSSSAVAGSYPFTITGTSASLTHTASATLVVTSRDFSLALSPASQSVTAGAPTGVYKINLSDLGGFTGPVSMSVTGLPAGATATFSPASITTSGTLTIATAATTAAGTYPISIKGTSGSLSHTVAATLIVNAIPGFKITLTPATQSTGRGSAVNYLITVVPTGGFNSKVQLTVGGLPSATVATFTANPVTGAPAWTSNLAIATTRNSAAGTFTLNVTATGGGLTAKASATLTLQ